jgi:pimeloyl-ACP methyl ester carboxylesterase
MSLWNRGQTDVKIHTFGEKDRPVVIMLPGSFCNADTMADIIKRLETEFYILAVDYSGQYAGSEKPFSSRSGEAGEIIRYLREHAISSAALVYGQSMGGEIGMELLSQMKKKHIAAGAAFFDGGPFLRFPGAVCGLLGSKFKTIAGNLRGRTLEEALREPAIVKFSGGRPERYSGMLGPICRNAAYMSDETLEREAKACVTFDYPDMDRDFQKNLYFFYSREESAWRFCHRKLKKAYPYAQYHLVSGYGHVGYPGEHPEEYCGWLSAAARGQDPFAS